MLIAAGALAYQGIATASAGFSGSTANENSLFEAATIDLVLLDDAPGTEQRFVIDAAGLRPGLIVERCLPLTYRGSLDEVTVRLHGNIRGGTGLEEHLLTVIETGSGTSVDCVDHTPSGTVFEGRLSTLWSNHGSFEDGMNVLSPASDGDGTTLRIAIEVDSDNRAQGLDTAFVMVVEARP